MREQAYAALRRAYQSFLGRAPESDEVLESHLGGDYSSGAVDRAVGFVSRSPEAEAYRQAQTTPPPTTTPPPGTTTPPPTTGPTTDPFETRPTAGDMGRVSGVDPRNWGSMNSVKYRLLELAARYPPNPGGLDQLMQDPDFKRLFPNARILDRNSGVIDVGGVLSDFTRGVPVTRVDMGESFNAETNTGKSWYWNDLVNTGASGPASPGAPQEWNWRAPTTTPPPTTTTPPTTPPPPGEESPKPPPFTPELPPIMTLGQMNQPQTPQTPQMPQVPVMPGQIKLSDLAKARGQRVGIY